MSQRSANGIQRPGLDDSFDADETLKSNLIIEGKLLVAQQQADAAAEQFARAAEIEVRLCEMCRLAGLAEKSWVHLFSAASCWARAGDFHTAIRLGEQLLTETELSMSLRQRVEDFTKTLRERRRQWGAGSADENSIRISSGFCYERTAKGGRESFFA